MGETFSRLHHETFFGLFSDKPWRCSGVQGRSVAETGRMSEVYVNLSMVRSSSKTGHLPSWMDEDFWWLFIS